MRFKAAIYMMLLGVVLVISGCGSTNEAYDKAVENGITAIEKEEYDSAVQFFEEAIEENKEDKQAASYLSQAQLLKDIEEAIESKNYEDAITYIEKIHNMDDPLDTVKEKAEKLEGKVKQEQAYQSEIDDIRSLIEEGEYDQAETKLSTIKNLLEGNSHFDKQLQELSLSLEEGRKKEETEAEAEVAKENEEEEKSKQEEENEHNQSSSYTYNRYANGRFGFSVKIPSSFTAGPEPTNGDGRVFTDGDCKITAYGSTMNVLEDNETVETYYKRALEDIGGVEGASYHTISGNSYVISYVEGDAIVYQKGITQNNCITTLIIEYPTKLSSQYDALVNEVSKSLTGGYVY